MDPQPTIDPATFSIRGNHLAYAATQSINIYLICVFQFSVAKVFVWLQKQFINNLFFPTWACAAGFNNNNIIIIIRVYLKFREINPRYSVGCVAAFLNLFFYLRSLMMIPLSLLIRCRQLLIGHVINYIVTLYIVVSKTGISSLFN